MSAIQVDGIGSELVASGAQGHQKALVTGREQPLDLVLDHRRALRRERPRVSRGLGVAARNIENANRLTRDGVAYRRGSTRRVVKSFAVVLRGEDLHGLAIRERGPDAIGSDVELSP